MIKIPLPVTAAGVAGAGMKAAAGAGSAALKFSKNLASITKETYKAGSNMFQSISNVDWDKPKEFFHSFYSFVQQFGIFSEFITPLMDIIDVMDAAIIRENVDAIIAWNRACVDLGRTIDDLITKLHDLDKVAEGIRGGGESAGGGGGRAGGSRYPEGERPFWDYIWPSNPPIGYGGYGAQMPLFGGGGSGGGRRRKKSAAEKIIDVLFP